MMKRTPHTHPATTASFLTHTSIDAPAEVTAETELPRHQAGQDSIISSCAELTGALSKLAPALARMVASHRAIRRRVCPPQPRRCSARQLARPDQAAAFSFVIFLG